MVAMIFYYLLSCITVAYYFAEINQYNYPEFILLKLHAD